MWTRRTVIAAGLAFASTASAAGAPAPATRPRLEAGSIDALFIDDSIDIPRKLAGFIKTSGGASPVVGLQLDANGQAGLMRVLDKSQAVVGVSSGATLFCVERIAWDHGFRLTARSQRDDGDSADDAFRQDLAAFLSGAVASPSPLARAYRPSRADGLLHAWVMQKSRPQLHRRHEV